MKKFILPAMGLMISTIALSQVRTGSLKYEVLDPNVAGKIFKNPIDQKNKPIGSPYLNKMFAAAKVENIAQSAYMRYNVFNDEFEFITSKNDTLILDKIEDFGAIAFIGLHKKYKLTTYTNSKNKLTYGYLIELYEKGGFALLMKENIDYYEGKKAKTSLERDMPARYSKTGDTYFLRRKDSGISEFPDGKKELIKLFPDKKVAIETFVKENEIEFGERADLIKIIDFLATL